MTAPRYKVGNYADRPGCFYVFTLDENGAEIWHTNGLPEQEARTEAARLEAAAVLADAAPELLDALRGLMRRYPEGPGTYTHEGAKAHALLARLTGWTTP